MRSWDRLPWRSRRRILHQVQGQADTFKAHDIEDVVRWTIDAAAREDQKL